MPLPTLEESCARFLDWCAPLLTRRRARRHRGRRRVVPGAGQPGTHAAGRAGAVRDRAGRAQLAGHVLAVPLPGPPRPHRAERELLLPVRRLRPGPGGAGGVPRRRGAGLQGPDRLRTPPARRRARAGALSMEQNRYLFSATRIPGPELDTARTPYTDEWPGPSTARHIVVFHRGNAVRLDVIGPDGRPHTVDEIAAGLRAVMAACATPAEPGTAVGHLTTMARAEWAASRRALLDLDPRNAANLDAIETRAVLPEPGGRGPRRPARGRRPAAARRQRQPVVRQGRHADRLPRRHGRLQRRALQARRHRRHRIPRHDPGSTPAAVRRRRRPGMAAAGLRARRRSARRRARRGRRVRRLRGRHRHHHAVGRLQRGAGQEAAVLAGRVRADGVPARPPAGQGPRRRDLRVDRHPVVPARADGGDACRHSRGAGVRRRDGGPRRRRPHPPCGVPGGGGEARRPRAGVPAGAGSGAAPVGAGS